MSGPSFDRVSHPPDDDTELMIVRGFLANDIISKLDEEEYFDILSLFENRLCRVFYGEINGGKRSQLENSLADKYGDVASLAREVDQWMRRHAKVYGFVLRRHDVRDWLRERGIPNLKSQWLENLARQIRLEFISACVEAMIEEGELWYDRGNHHWTMTQSRIDRYELALSRARCHRKKFDRRNYHGRVREQSISRGIPAGTSIGACA